MQVAIFEATLVQNLYHCTKPKPSKSSQQSCFSTCVLRLGGGNVHTSSYAGHYETVMAAKIDISTTN